MKYAFALVALAAATPTVASAATITDGSFETQGAASPGSFCYFLGNYGGACAAGAWTGGGQTSGLQNETNTAWPGQATPSGSYYAFIQSGFGAPGSISQSLTLASGSYNFSWLAAGRPGSAGNQTYDVTLTGTSGVFSLASGASVTTGQAFTPVSSGPVTVAAGTYTLTFAAQASGSDSTAFIDNVSVASVPEPATWAMMLIGFGGVGGAMRRRRGRTAERVAYA